MSAKKRKAGAVAVVPGPPSSRREGHLGRRMDKCAHQRECSRRNQDHEDHDPHHGNNLLIRFKRKQGSS
jgi:hypothetical protein